MKTKWLAVLALSSGCASVADLRPETLKATPPTAAQETEGQAILQKMVAAHGGIDNWRKYNFMHAKAEDAWFSKFIFALVVPYADNPEHVVVSSYTQRLPDGRVELPGGNNEGDVWFLKGDQFTVKKSGENAETKAMKDEAIHAVLTANFLFWPGMPFYLATADKVANVGKETIAGAEYHKLFLSWNDYAPQTDTDQWVLWVNTQTHMLEYVHFTARVAGQGQNAIIGLRDFVEVQGMKVALKYDGMGKLGDDPLHTYTYSDIVFSNREYVDLVKTTP